MPKFGMQAYFVSLPSAWMGETEAVEGREGAVSGSSEYDAVLTFSGECSNGNRQRSA